MESKEFEWPLGLRKKEHSRFQHTDVCTLTVILTSAYRCSKPNYENGFFFILLTHLGSWLAMYILALNSSMNISLTFKSICSVLSRMVSKLSRCKKTVRLCIFMWNVFSNKGRDTDRFSTPEMSVRPAALASVSFKRQSKALYNELVVNPLKWKINLSYMNKKYFVWIYFLKHVIWKLYFEIIRCNVNVLYWYFLHDVEKWE